MFLTCILATIGLLLSATSPTAAAAVRAAGNCSASGISTPKLPGTETLSFTATPISSYKFSNSTINICNVTIVYTHTKWNDTITTTVWLPLDKWDGRFIGTGGGGMAVRSGDSALAEQVLLGRVAVATDGGHQYANTFEAGMWALNKDNSVNYGLLQDYAGVSLGDAAILGKAVTKSFYGKDVSYAYWNGCSTGGRQGHYVAQRYPNAYNGILASAPAINFVSMVPASSWPLLVMSNTKNTPAPCVLTAFNDAAIAACDTLDGLKDGIISAPDRCKFDPYSIVGRPVNCGNYGNTTITETQASVVDKIWKGATSTNGTFLWYGVERGTPMIRGLVNTNCTDSLNTCTAVPFGVSREWIKYWVLQKPETDIYALTYREFDSIMAASKEKYNDIIASNNPDLSAFKSAGGKMITWHGLADTRIFHQGTRQYYQNVQKLDPDLREFYRYYEAPGVDHCGSGTGPSPVDGLAAVIAWVENGTVPETLPAKAGDGRQQDLCTWPLVSAYIGGDKQKASSYACKSEHAAPLT